MFANGVRDGLNNSLQDAGATRLDFNRPTNFSDLAHAIP